MNWKLSDGRPIWLQLREQMTQRILTGEYPPGGKLPSVRELAAEAGVNPNTMQKALTAMEEEGLIETHRTAGRIVTEQEETLHAVRNVLASKLAEEYLQGMMRLGFGEAEAKTMLMEVETWNLI